MPTTPSAHPAGLLWTLLVLLLVVSIQPTIAIIKVDSPLALEKLFNFNNDVFKFNVVDEKLNPIDLFLEDIIPSWFGQAPNNQNGTHPEFKTYTWRDVSNDDAQRLTGQQLIARSGYKYEVFDAIAEDGYITTITRIINPLADPTKLRQPPVLMEHGGTIDPTAYLIASSIQHFPEKYPRTADDGPWRSWNRSLAFHLSNCGFDVWLAETRGSNDLNKRHIKTKAMKSILAGSDDDRNMTIGEKFKEIAQQWNFWAFSQDDIIAHELRSHIDAVLKFTGSQKLHLMTFSLSTPTSLAFLGQRPEYAEKIQGYISMAPIISGQGTSGFIDILFKTICPFLPQEVGTLLLTDLIFTQPFRELLVFISRNKSIRYSLTKAVTTILMGSSAKWRTLLDLNLLGHLFRQLSFKELKQMCQQMSTNRLQKFDYGPFKNQLIYGSDKPPVYDISNLKISNWIVVSGPNDALSTPAVIDHLFEMVNPKPIAHIVAPDFNHMDLFAGWENDIYVNQPIERYLEKMSWNPDDSEASHTPASARGLDLKSLIPTFIQPKTLISEASNVTGVPLTPVNLFDPKPLLEAIVKGLEEFIKLLTGKLENQSESKASKGTETKSSEQYKPKSTRLNSAKYGRDRNEPETEESKVLGQNVLGGNLLNNVGKVIDPKGVLNNVGQAINGLNALGALTGASSTSGNQAPGGLPGLAGLGGGMGGRLGVGLGGGLGKLFKPIKLFNNDKK